MQYVIDSRKADMPPYAIDCIIHHKNSDGSDYWTANIMAEYTDTNNVKHDNLITHPTAYTNEYSESIDWNKLKIILEELGLGKITKKMLKCDFYTKRNGVSTYYKIVT